jgi:hypothetical protein
MAIDQRDVSSTLRFMDDSALQQYAAMHKNDPYIFPLAFQESQNRQRLRMNQQAAQGMQQQPKVNEQALAQMAPPQAQPMPEDVGIATLPAPNMTMAADGGIMGYPDDANFAERSEPVVMMAGGGVARYNGAQGSVTASSELQSLLAARERYVQAGADTSGIDQAIAFLQAKPGRAAAQRAAAGSAPPAKMPGFAEQMAQDIAPPTPITPTPFKGTMPEAGYTYKGMENDPRLNTPPSKPFVAAPKPDAGRKTKPAAEAARNEPAAEKDKDPAGIDALMAKLTRETDLAQGALRNQRVGLASQLEQEALGTKEEGEKRRKERGDVFAGKEARLAEREKGVAGLGDKYMGLALLQAGAAMMSTPGSIGMALGKGIQVGSERYIAGIDKINAAKDKFAEARDRLDELRLNRDDMNDKEIKEENSAIRRARIQGQQLLTEGATKDLEMTNANFREFFKAGADDLKTNKTLEAERKNVLTRESGANVRSAGQIAATLNTPERMAFMSALEKTKTKENPQGDPAAAYQSVVAMKREPQTSETLLKAWSGNMLLQQQYPNPQDYIKMMVGSAGGASQLSPADAALVSKYSR